MSLFTSGKIKLLLLPLLVAAAFLILNSKLKHVEDAPVMDVAPWALAMSSVRQGSVSSGFPALGRVQSASEVRITPQISGRILALGPRAGGSVGKGDLLVHLDTRELEASRDALKSKLISAEAVAGHDRRELVREKKLFKEGGSAASAVEQWQTTVRADNANVGSLKEQVRQLQVKIGYGHIHAPISAGISQRLAEIGDTAMPGKTLYVLSAQRGGRVVVPVPLQTLTRIQAGGEVRLSQGSESMLARITRINPALDQLAMGSLEIDLPQRPFGLPDGAHISARVLTKKLTDALIVPADALLPVAASQPRVLFKVTKEGDSYRLRKIVVKVLLCGAEGCAVQGDIQLGEQVVSGHGSVLLKLTDGDAVIAANRVGTTS
ncbi:MAG: efflux RND transporter periplasmic adaptor subunit [Mariprofundaceae bacterium]|nr:efflux RND transporter periplasmic adaptor subunit [Mariprofundaceae bacterium]